MRMPGAVAFDQAGVLHGVAQLQTVAREKTIWGDPTNEVVGFTILGPSERVKLHAVSKFDNEASHWLPNIERPTGHNLVPKKPGVIYTGGSPGSKNTELIRNKVFWGT